MKQQRALLLLTRLLMQTYRQQEVINTRGAFWLFFPIRLKKETDGYTWFNRLLVRRIHLNFLHSL